MHGGRIRVAYSTHRRPRKRSVYHVCAMTADLLYLYIYVPWSGWSRGSAFMQVVVVV